MSGFSEFDAEQKLREASGFAHDHVHNEQNCPICKLVVGWTGATCIEDSVTGEGYDQHDQYYQDVEYVYELACFYCPNCELTLNTDALIEAAGLEHHYGWCSTEYPDDPYLADMRDQALVDLMSDD